MVTATLVHIETGIEFHKEGSLYNPTRDEKLLWGLFGTPPGIERLEQTFETEIDKLTGNTKKEIQLKCDKNFQKGVYSFLPTIGFNQNVELRW